MSWNDYEYSTADGQPVTLYEFIRGGAQYFRFTNADRDITLGSVLWCAEAISDNGMSQNTGDSVEVTVPAANAVVDLFRGVPPSSPVSVKISRFHYSDDKAEIKVVSVGRISELRREDGGTVKLICASLASTFTRNGLRITWGRNCHHSLYDHNCRVNPADYGVAGLTVTGMDGAAITLNLPAGVPEGYFSGGYIEYITDGITERRGTRAQTGNVVGLFGGTSGLSMGMTISIWPGCDYTIAICDARFNNRLNYGGVPHLPGKSPYQIIKLF